MSQCLAEEQKLFLTTAELHQAEAILAQALQDESLEDQEMAELAMLLVQSARYDLAAMVFAKWTERAPTNPEPWTNLGYCLLKQNKAEDAKAITEYALELSPDYFPAKTNLCDIYLQLGLYAQQLDMAQACLTAQPQSCVAHNNLGTALWHNGQIDKAKQAFAESLRIDSQYFEARLNLGKLMSDEGEHVAAKAEFETLLREKHLDAHTREVVEFYLAFEYLNAGQLQQGWEMYERGFSASVSPLLARQPHRTFQLPKWLGEPLQKDQKLLIWREQGIGDELRFLALLQTLKVDQSQWIIETDPRLVDVLQRAFPKALVRPQRWPLQDAAMPTLGYQIPVGSLPSLYMASSAHLPKLSGYLSASPWQVGRFAQRLSAHAGKTKIGICWRSHKLNAVRNKKYSALKDWEALLRMPNTCFVSLQYGEAEAEILDVEKQLGISIVRWPDVDLKDDLEAVLGLMQNLDHVVSTSTAVVPLAGALGRPTVFLGHASWMLLGKTDHYPWHASVKPVLVPKNLPVSSGIQEVVRYLESISALR